MARVKGGAVSKNRRRKVLKQAKGYFGSKHRLYKTAQEQLFHSGAYAFRDRKQNKRNFRKLWITRINAACRENDISYSKFINGLNKAGIEINRKMLSELAIDDPKSFTALVVTAKKALLGEEIKAEVKETVKEVKKETKKEEQTQPTEPETPNTEETNNNNTNVYYPNDYWDYMNVPFMNVDFNELLKKNPDTVGWIKVEGTKVNYPVVQASDNNYYLSHAFNKTANQGGWIFADYKNKFDDTDKNIVIYGHNMNNKTMFGSIPNMLYNGYLSNSSNYYIKISTPTSNSVWKVFSIYTVDPQTYYLKTNFKSEPYSKFLSTLKSRSIYNFGIDVSENDKILTLSTCDNTGTKRVAVHAKMINIEYK